MLQNSLKFETKLDSFFQDPPPPKEHKTSCILVLKYIYIYLVAHVSTLFNADRIM